MSRRSIAEISPATSSRSPTPAANGKARQPDAASRLAGIADALDLTREEAERLRDGRKTQTVTWRQLDDALAALAVVAREPLPAPDDLGPRLEKLAVQADTMADIARALAAERGDEISFDMLFWAQASVNAIAAHRDDFARAPKRRERCGCGCSGWKTTARSMALAMDFGFLLDRERKLLSIGYLAPEGALDSNCYDLLASEARLASFFAIAKGDVPARHWFRLGRAVIPVAHGAALISWSGSMFEYLMPSLVMRAPAGSLLDADQPSDRAAADRLSPTSCGLPWGVSESAYNARDLEFTYQYSNFGVPGLGLKRGLGDNLVVAPYATALAAMVDPPRGSRNFDAARRHRRARPLRLLRGARLHAGARARRPGPRHRARLHGASSGHDHRRHRRRLARRRDAGAVPRRAHGPGHRTAVAGAHAARCGRQPSLGGRNASPPSARARDVEPPGRTALLLGAAGDARRRICCPTAAMPSC